MSQINKEVLFKTLEYTTTDEGTQFLVWTADSDEYSITTYLTNGTWSCTIDADSTGSWKVRNAVATKDAGVKFNHSNGKLYISYSSQTTDSTLTSRIEIKYGTIAANLPQVDSSNASWTVIHDGTTISQDTVNNLNVDGITTVSETLITNELNVGSSINGGSVTVSGDLNVTGSTTSTISANTVFINSDLNIVGETTVSETLITNELNVGSSINGGSVTVSGDLNVTGSTSTVEVVNLTASGATTVSNTLITNTLQVGTESTNGSVTVSGDLIVNGEESQVKANSITANTNTFTATAIQGATSITLPISGKIPVDIIAEDEKYYFKYKDGEEIKQEEITEKQYNALMANGMFSINGNLYANSITINGDSYAMGLASNLKKKNAANRLLYQKSSDETELTGWEYNPNDGSLTLKSNNNQLLMLSSQGCELGDSVEAVNFYGAVTDYNEDEGTIKEKFYEIDASINNLNSTAAGEITVSGSTVTLIALDGSTNLSFGNIDNVANAVSAQSATNAMNYTNSNGQSQGTIISKFNSIENSINTVNDSISTLKNNLNITAAGEITVSDSTITLKALDGSTSIGSVTINNVANASSATVATSLSTNAGSSNTPVYFTGGKPVACKSLSLNTTGNAATATNATHAVNADSASNAVYATSAGTVSISTQTLNNDSKYALFAISNSDNQTIYASNTSLGSTTQPIYINAGKFAECNEIKAATLTFDSEGDNAYTEDGILYQDSNNTTKTNAYFTYDASTNYLNVPNIKLKSSTQTYAVTEEDQTAYVEISSNRITLSGYNDDINTTITTGSINTPEIFTTNITSNGNISSAGTITAANFNATSDRRLKNNIEVLNPEESALDFINSLNLYTFNYNSMPDERSIGVIAQELQEKEFDGVSFIAENDEGYLSVKEGKMVYLLIRAIQEQSQKISELETRIHNLEAKHE